jgi:Fe-S-cluster-containing dehydrogenase component/CRP-like cAMP-binding protein
MSVPSAAVSRPQRWDVPFGSDMTEADVDALLARPEIAAIQADNFPPHIPLRKILLNDARIVAFEPGDIVVREADYGNSAFLILSGQLRVVLAPGLPGDALGRQPARKKSFVEALSQLWTNPRIPEVRDPQRYRDRHLNSRRARDGMARVFLQDVPAVLSKHRTATLEAGAVFGELAALGRVPRTATILAETPARLLEIRWQGLRDLRRYDAGWKRQIDATYRRNALQTHLEADSLFAGLSPAARDAVAERVKFKTYGSFDWHVSYKEMRGAGRGAPQDEPVIAAEGTRPDGIYLVRAGFARVSVSLGNGRRTLSYLGAGDHFGLEETYEAWRTGKPVYLQRSLSALGYVDVLRVPAHVLEKHVFPTLPVPAPQAVIERPIEDDAFVEWLVDERFINGSQAMLIDLDRCVRCDDCVRACASTHGGNPRFVRHGAVFDHWMVANACMHCRDPVCMIGCPTGAIHRHETGGVVVINDDTCIGCGTCANSCPYDNIRLVEVADRDGVPLADDVGRPIVKATKCDLCSDQLGGPACARACPRGAMRRVSASTLVKG